jgi:acetyltransferase-like isoleucine patch superfamily enzyme
MQWLIHAEQQHRFRPYFRAGCLRERYCFVRILLHVRAVAWPWYMGAALAQIIERASPRGARWALTYVRTDNVASLKSCARAGFRPYMLRTESWRGFRPHQSFRVLEQPALYPFERESDSHIADVKAPVTTNQKNLLRRGANRILHKLARTVPGTTTLRPVLHRWRGVAIGHNVFIGDEVYLESEFPELVTIGDGTTIGLRAVIIAHVGQPELKIGLVTGRVVIGKNVLIGACSFIAASPGASLTIGDGAVIGPCSVIINTNIPAQAFVKSPVAQQVAIAHVALVGHSYRQFVAGLRIRK